MFPGGAKDAGEAVPSPPRRHDVGNAGDERSEGNPTTQFFPIVNNATEPRFIFDRVYSRAKKTIYFRSELLLVYTIDQKFA